jgi:hypothetical protein
MENDRKWWANYPRYLLFGYGFCGTELAVLFPTQKITEREKGCNKTNCPDFWKAIFAIYR